MHTLLLSSMADMNNPGAGPLSGVPLRDKCRSILRGPSRMNGPSRGTSLAERMGVSQFDTGSGRVDLVLVKHTPMGSGKTSGSARATALFPLCSSRLQATNGRLRIRCRRCDAIGLMAAPLETSWGIFSVPRPNPASLCYRYLF